VPAPVDAAVELAGQRVKLEGSWVDGRLVAHKLKFRNPRRNAERGQVDAVIDNVDPVQRLVTLGPFSAHWNADTVFIDGSAADLENGVRVEIDVEVNGGDVLEARTIEFKDGDDPPGHIEVLGAIGSVAILGDGANLVRVLGIPCELPGKLTSSLVLLTRRQDDRRPEDQLSMRLFGRELTIGGEIELNSRHREDFELDPREDDDRARVDNAFQLEFLYLWNHETAVFLEFKGAAEVEIYRQGGGEDSEMLLERGEMWLFMGALAGSRFSLQVGRQNFQDGREWWWDEDLDALRVYYATRTWRVWLGIGEQFAREALSANFDARLDPAEEDVLNVLAHLEWQWSSDHAFELFFLHQYDHSPTERVGDVVREDRTDTADGELTWLGARTVGDLALGGDYSLDYWTDFAAFTSRERRLVFDAVNDRDARVVERVAASDDGWAADIGATLTTPWPWRPALTLAYARGSRNFRQTGLNNNNDRYTGVNRFRYYGELARPELANLAILSAAIGLPFWYNSSVELVFHDYRQVARSRDVRDFAINADLTGRDTHLGQAIDIAVGIEENSHVEIEFIAGLFVAGAAYGPLEGRTALNLQLKFNYNF
ncbi:MAG: alginate export family protein, partial [Gammaproteobacteria bacterium]